MRLKAFLNSGGGTLRTMDVAAYGERVEAAFRRAGHEIEVVILDAPDLIDAMRWAADAGGIDALVVGGGDGTVSAAAGIAWQNGLALGVIPAGTMNLFARSLGLPLDVEAVLDVLAHAPVRNVDIATVNERPFVHQFAAGLHARMVVLREGMEYASRLGKIRANLRAAFGVVANPPAFDVEFAAAGQTGTRRVSAVSVSNNAFGANPLLVADDISGGRLGFYLADALPPLGVARLSLDLLFGRLQQNAAVNFTEASEVELRFPRATRTSRCIVDGELLPMPRNVVVKIHAGALRVLAPSKPG